MSGISNKGNEEKYAILSLIEVYDRSLSVLLDDEKEYERPDFQSESLDLGIEVAQGITKKQGNQRAMINKLFGKGYSGSEVIEKTEKQKEFKHIKGKARDFNGTACVELDYNASKVIQKLSSEIKDKTDLLNNDYKVFKRNWLYIFSPYSIITKSEITAIELEIKSLSNPLNYDKIFINLMDRIYIIDVHSTIKEISISDNTLKYLKAEAGH